jgi:hypothetical protein
LRDLVGHALDIGARNITRAVIQECRAIRPSSIATVDKLFARPNRVRTRPTRAAFKYSSHSWHTVIAERASDFSR